MTDKVQRLIGRMRDDLSQVTPSAIRSFDQEVSKIPGIIKLTLGEPDFNTPEHIKNAAIESIKENHTHYAPSNGTPELRAAVANFLDKKYQLNYSAENVIVTVGATESIWTAVSSIVNRGDKVIIPTPIWPMYIPITKVNGAEPVFLDTSDNHFVLTPEKLEQAIKENGDAVKAVVLNFPSNPTGMTYRREDVKAIAEVVKKYDVFVIADEIYSELTYGDKHVSIAEYLPDQTILINGVSKSHAMTGWRIGVLCAPEPIIKQLAKIHQYSVTTATRVAQDAAQEAFENGFEDGSEMKLEYEKRANFVYEEMTKMGFTAHQPEGAFYLFTKIPASLNMDDKTFCRKLAYENKVALVAGSSFGPGGEGYIRISYAASMDNLKESMKRIKEFMGSRV
ncbi:aspartate aminotransferase [Paucilactobacillus hokkaidonensis JCM 18461]|uniref:Aminotransferase n=2 Tax=Paucilactobacillus hokkaidonensis TaxID=1193095 RepID=A0A0A1GVY7_9LACO|nr:aminotransferase class I/II-fold pyridoxal phosphate-dependent enzyme [Paucilactobacillus hokkaidonensis]KRO11200.1 bifunctional protein amino acid aminotransferase [Paucilactobacillus hokkaidonensis]BAP86437.1 aspartate aminotransferase [Paucilactobacillus hokkaidonensis JCM 18461]